MKKLPELYKNEFSNPKDNNKKSIKVEKAVIQENNIEEELHNIFHGIGHAYNNPVTIKTKNQLYNTYLIAKTRNSVITMENETIPIEEIIYLKSKKN